MQKTNISINPWQTSWFTAWQGIDPQRLKQKIIEVYLRSTDNLIHVEWDGMTEEWAIYVDLQIPAWATPNTEFEIGVTTWHVLQADGWIADWTLLVAKNADSEFQMLYADNGMVYYKKIDTREPFGASGFALETSIAELFSSSKAYSEWDVVMYEWDRYYAKEDLVAWAWNPAKRQHESVQEALENHVWGIQNDTTGTTDVIEKIWSGTKAEYDALTSYDPDIYYIITDQNWDALYIINNTDWTTGRVKSIWYGTKQEFDAIATKDPDCLYFVDIKYRTYTVVYNETESPNSQFVRYMDDATGMTRWSTDFDEFFGYSAVRLAEDWTETAEITQEDSGGAGKLDVTQLGTLTNGDDVMIKFPVRWIKIEKHGSQVWLSITEDPNKDWFQYYAFQNTWDIETNTSANTKPLYIGAYQSYHKPTTDTMLTVSGNPPMTSKTMAQFINYSTTKGAWWNMIWWYQTQLINAYYIMKYGRLDAQEQVWWWNSSGSSFTVCGLTNSQINATYGGGTNVSMKLFGLEDWRWNMEQLIGWVFVDSSNDVYVALHDFTANKDITESQYKKIGTANVSSSRWLYTVLWTNKWMFLPTSSGYQWNYDRYYCDRVALVWDGFIARWWMYTFQWWCWPFCLMMENTGTGSATVCSRLMYHK